MLLKIGYIEDNITNVHIHFCHPSNLSVELHWKLINEEYAKDTSCFEDNIWKNALPFQIECIYCMMPSLEDQVLHLCLHMAVHLLYSGFGLRQLCDLVLLVEAKADTINWDTFCEKARTCGIERFVHTVFMICRILFGMEIPYGIQHLASTDSYYQRLLINEISRGGVYGVIDPVHLHGIALLRHSLDRGMPYTLRSLSYFVTLAFPDTKDIQNRYPYTKKIPRVNPCGLAKPIGMWFAEQGLHYS